MSFKNYAKGISRLARTFTIEVGDFRARGAPAVLIGISGIVLASGIACAIGRSAQRLPETLREARGLAEALRTAKDATRLHA